MGGRLIPSAPPHQTDGEYSHVTERGMDLDVGESLAEDGVYANGGNDAFRLGFVGAGNMAESIAHGVAAPGVLAASAVRAAPHRRPERGAAFASLGATILASNTRVVDDSDVIVISVKPQIVKQVLVELKPLLSEEKLLVSIAVGIKMKDLQDWSGQRQIIALDCKSLLLLGHGIV